MKYPENEEENSSGEKKPESKDEKPIIPSNTTENDESENIHRHPTGKPDQTGGWYTSDQEPEDGHTSAEDAGQEEESPGGWYAELDKISLEDGLQKDIEKSMEDTRFQPLDHKSEESETIPPDMDILSDEELPKAVSVEDKFATQVSTAAFKHATSQKRRKPIVEDPNRRKSVSRRNASRRKPVEEKKGAKNSSGFSGQGCLVKGLLGVAIFFIIIGVILASFLLFKYFTLRASLPDIEDLKSQVSQFETTRILDRNGNLLYELLDPNAGRRTYTDLEDISPYVIAATIATEDKEYYNHPGYDLMAMLRALWQNYTNQEIVSGASTITQQLGKMLLFTFEERFDQSYDRKAREIILAAEITRKYTKEEILEMYLNELNYGNYSYGIEAAAESYFGTTAKSLTLSQAAFLVGLPQAPYVYDVYTNREATLNRFKDVIVLIYEASVEYGCIPVRTTIQPVCVTVEDLNRAVNEIEAYEFEFQENQMAYPHWVNFIRAELEEMYEPQTIYRSGFTVYTTLDPNMQDLGQQLLLDQTVQLADRNVHGGALVAIDPNTGEILAMIGSPDYNNEQYSGQINMAVNPRQPGSSIKPLTYLAAFEKGWTPSTLIWDVPSEFPPSGDPEDLRPPYVPENYDDAFHGPVTLRSALANSYNVPAVKALDFVGIYDDPETEVEEGLVKFAERLGITTLTQPDYGLSLTLGGGDVTLLQMTAAYATMANQGVKVDPYAITKIIDHDGEVVFEYEAASPEQVIREEHAYLISSILSDNNARSDMFGLDSYLNLPFPAAAKTGTTNDYRDNWTLGYTPDIAVGVWVGNPDYTPMINTSGLTGAAPVWSAYMQAVVPYLTQGEVNNFIKPSGVVEEVICETSGTKPSEWCTSHIREYFAYDQLPLGSENDLWRNVEIDTWTGKLASSECPDFKEDAFLLNVTEEWAVKWINETAQGENWAESLGFSDPVEFYTGEKCSNSDPRPTILFAGLSNGQQIVENPLDIYALIKASGGFKEYRLEYGIGSDLDNWTVLVDNQTDAHDPPDRIYTWDLSSVEAGSVTLRIYLISDQDTYAERRILLNLQVPTPTATNTITPTITNTVTLTPTVTMTPEMTETPTITPTETETPTLTNTP